MGLNEVNPNIINHPNYITQSFAPLYYNNIEVEKIFYFINNIKQTITDNKIKKLKNVVIDLHPSQYFESKSYITGQIFDSSSTNIFENNKVLSFKALTTSGSFTNKNVNVNIVVDDTLIRKVIIDITDI